MILPKGDEELMLHSCPVNFWARQSPERPALATPRAIVSYIELDNRIGLWQERLKSLGVEFRDRVVMIAESSIDYLCAMRAIGRNNAAVFPLNPKLPLAALAEFIALAETKLVLCSEAWAAPLREATSLSAESIVVLDSNDSLRQLPTPATGFADAKNPDHTGLTPFGEVLIASSGSTGAPKVAVFWLQMLAANALRSNKNIPLNKWPRNCWLLSLPLFHVSGLGVLFRTWQQGGIVALPDPSQPLSDAISMFRPTHLSLVATQLRRLMSDASTLNTLTQASAILLGGSAIPEELIRAAHAAHLRIHTTYGLTEMGSQVTTTHRGAKIDELLTSGYPLEENTIRISDTGEIEVHGDTLFWGYSRPNRTFHRPKTADGWFPTGDLGRFDDAGRLIVVGRKDNLFISGGENIHPEEVERALLALPGVEQAIVVPVPDAEFVEVGFAFVEVGERAVLDADVLRAGLRGVLPTFKIPRHIHAWPSDLASTGIKPSRKALQDRANALLKKP